MGATCCNSDKDQNNGETSNNFTGQNRHQVEGNLELTDRDTGSQFPPSDVAVFDKDSENYIKVAEQKMIEIIGSYLPDYKSDIKLSYGGPYRYVDDNENSGTIYQGNFKNGKRHGKGTMLFQHGTIFMGYFDDDLFDKKGAISDPKYWYVGEWEKGICKGHGVYCMFDDEDPSLKTIYDGMFEDNARHGRGKETYPDGSVYEGQYINNFKTGRGKFIWKEGATYEGDFVDNNIHGFGKYVWNDERIYEGEWVNNKMEGKGTFLWKDGRVS